MRWALILLRIALAVYVGFGLYLYLTCSSRARYISPTCHQGRSMPRRRMRAWSTRP